MIRISRDGGVQSVDRALSIIEVLAEDDEGYRLTDLAVRTGLSTSTVHRLLATLEKRRFVQFDRTELNCMSARRALRSARPSPVAGFYGVGDAVFAQAAGSYP